ncbi:MAG: hypothetical protein ABLQ96_05010 [Candidatus Acidiferrum sp.]
MGRVFSLTIFLIFIPAGLLAQGSGNALRSGGVMPAASSQAVPAGAAHVNAGAPAMAGARMTSSPGSHLMISRSPSGQTAVRRAAVGVGTRNVDRGHLGGAAGHGGQVNGSRRRNGISDFSPEFDAAPGLGFDYVHFAATHPNAGNSRHHHGNDGALLFPFSGGGYFLPADLGAAGVENALGDETAAEDSEGDEDPRPAARRRAPVRSVDRLPVLGPPAPQRDVPEYVFVRRDGTVFFAVAYSWERGSLRYVSSEGLRRSVERETLDLDATQQFNEQRGMVFRAPA